VTESGFVVRADEKLTEFLELQRAIHEFAVNLISYTRIWNFNLDNIPVAGQVHMNIKT
jgi:hypothetical protein